MDMAGFNQKALCEATGISKRLMSEIVNGTRNATAPNLKLIADALRCPVPMLLAKDAA